MRKQSGQVHSRESSATLQLTVSLLYQEDRINLPFEFPDGKIKIHWDIISLPVSIASERSVEEWQRR